MYTKLIELLKKEGIELEKGLLIEEIDEIEQLFDIQFPPELKNMYMSFLPVSNGFYKWRDFSIQNVEYIISIIKAPVKSMENDIEDIEWGDNWGEEPAELEQRIKIVKEKLKLAPKLIPIYSHRYIASGRIEQTPIFSIYGTDIIYYGENLEKYFEIEFGGKSYNDIQYNKIIEIPFWSDIL